MAKLRILLILSSLLISSSSASNANASGYRCYSMYVRVTVQAVSAPAGARGPAAPAKPSCRPVVAALPPQRVDKTRLQEGHCPSRPPHLNGYYVRNSKSSSIHNSLLHSTSKVLKPERRWSSDTTLLSPATPRENQSSPRTRTVLVHETYPGNDAVGHPASSHPSGSRP